MTQPFRCVFAFGDFRLDPSDRTLFHQGEPVPLAPKVFDALLLLVENAGHLVEKDEFMQRLWPHTFVGDEALAQNIFLLRKVLSLGSKDDEFIVTVPKRGYRFVGTVRQADHATGAAKPPSLAVSNWSGKKVSHYRIL